jgi:hypothetical protein
MQPAALAGADGSAPAIATDAAAAIRTRFMLEPPFLHLLTRVGERAASMRKHRFIGA